MKKRRIMILILLLVIGFASVTTTLVLNGSIGVGVELDDFDVIFIESLLDGKEDIRTSISEDKKTITFSTDKLINVGDSSRLDYKVKNTSTQYNADVEINCTNEANEYVNVTSEFDGNEIPLKESVNIEAQEIKSGYINAELIKAYAGEDTSVEIKCAIVVTATSRETYAYSLNFNSNGGNNIDDKSVVLNEEYGELEEPIREGYTFLGWYDEEDNRVASSTILDSKGNRNLKAKWKVNEYPVKIVTNEHGNSEVNSINVVYNETINLKVTPNKNYYLSSVECSDGYSIENFDSKIPIYEEQSITIRNNKKAESGECVFTFGQGIFEYEYTGNAQTFSVPLNGHYKLEVWGAQGGTAGNYQGGYGGYSYGEVNLSNDETLYIIVGGKGNVVKNTSIAGGYNGGGNALTQSTSDNAGSGGGATHIATTAGLLSSLSNKKDTILIVAGGGGGAYYHSNYASSGGAGDGINGTYIANGVCSGRTRTYGTNASQTAGGKGVNCGGVNTSGSFGTGGAGTRIGWSSGGGGGYYGGGTGYAAGAQGGSGYIGNSRLSNKAMYCYNCTTSNEESTKTISTTSVSSSAVKNYTKTGNGHAKITYIGN